MAEFSDSWVAVTFERSGEGTLVRLEQTGFERDEVLMLDVP